MSYEHEAARINSVFGINPEGKLPARFLTGFIPAFEMAQQISDARDGAIAPSVRIFIPAHISALANGLDASAVEAYIRSGQHMIQTLQENHFPHINVFFEQDKPITDEAVDVLKEVADVISEHAAHTDLRRSTESGLRHGGLLGQSNSTLYNPHHSFGWNDLHHAAIFESEPPFLVLNVLPPSEDPYRNIRQSVKDGLLASGQQDLLCHGRHFDVMLKMCDVPHYLVITDDAKNSLEPTLNQGISCGEMRFTFEQSISREQNPGRRENLRRALADFDDMLSFLSHGKTMNLNEVCLPDLLASRG